jgi:hypothetical protein
MVYEELDSTGAANEILNIREPVRALPTTPRHSLVDGPVQQIDGDGPLVPGIIERARAGASVEVEGTCRTDEGVLAGATNEALNIVECIRALPSMKDKAPSDSRGPNGHRRHPSLVNSSSLWGKWVVRQCDPRACSSRWNRQT